MVVKAPHYRAFYYLPGLISNYSLPGPHSFSHTGLLSVSGKCLHLKKSFFDTHIALFFSFKSFLEWHLLKVVFPNAFEYYHLCLNSGKGISCICMHRFYSYSGQCASSLGSQFFQYKLRVFAKCSIKPFDL